jgi:hypothetical protein
MSLASSMYGYKYSFSVGNDVLYNKKISKILELVNERDEDIDDFMPLYKIQEYDSKIVKTYIPEDQLFPVSDIDIINYNNALRRSIDLEKLAVRYNSFIKDNIYKLTFDLELYIFEFTPIKVFLTIDEKHYFLVIMYELRMTNRTNNIVTKAEIPYYISDGHTNLLRANLLFPFICFNESLSQYSCPFSQTGMITKGGLFKYVILENINLNEYHENIEELLGEKMPIKNIDITSVLPRIVNLLDLFICLNNKNLINYNEGKLKHYYPIRDKKLKVTNKLSLDMSKKDDLSFYRFGIRPEDDYRELLLPVLQNLIINFQKLPFFKSEIVDITLTIDNIVTKPYFNSFIIKNPICKGPKINDDSRRNIDIYSEISLQFGQQFKKCLNEIKKELDTIDEINIINRYEKGYPIKKQYPIEFEMLINEVLDLIKDKPSKKNIINQLNMWNINCNYKKYKKYKMKYIALKAKMLENI